MTTYSVDTLLEGWSTFDIAAFGSADEFFDEFLSCEDDGDIEESHDEIRAACADAWQRATTYVTEYNARNTPRR